jgi:DUF971 family protein
VTELVLTEVRRLAALPGYRLTWNDGHAAEFDDAYLRGWCPCALCQGHDNVEIVFHPPPGAVEALSVQPVGSYGISIAWSDGHATGIYRFAFLREICPCGECRRAGSPRIPAALPVA